MKYHFLAFIAILSLFLIQPVSAIPQITITSPQNITYDSGTPNVILSVIINEYVNWSGYSLNGSLNITTNEDDSEDANWNDGVPADPDNFFDEDWGTYASCYDTCEFMENTSWSIPPVYFEFKFDNAAENVIHLRCLNYYSGSFDTLYIAPYGSSGTIRAPILDDCLAQSPLSIDYFSSPSGFESKFYEGKAIFNASINQTVGVSDGIYNITVYANDTSGNLNFSTVYFTITPLPPVITIITPENTNYNDTTLLLNYTSNSDLEDGWFSLDGGANNSLIGLSFEENLSTYSCTGSFYGLTPAANIFDGIYATAASTTLNATCYFNRTRPANGSLSANLSVALGDPGVPTDCLGIWNATVSQNCLGNYIGDIVQFKLFMTVESPYGTDWSCWNGTDWESFFSCYGQPIDDDVREEAIWWITTKPIIRKYFTAENGSHTINVCGENAGGENCSQRNFTILTITPPIPPTPPAPEPEVPLASGVILSTILIAGGLISFLGIVFTTKDIKYIVGGMIFLLIILTLSAQMLIII